MFVLVWISRSRFTDTNTADEFRLQEVMTMRMLVLLIALSVAAPAFAQDAQLIEAAKKDRPAADEEEEVETASTARKRKRAG